MTVSKSQIARWFVLYLAIISGEDADELSLAAPLAQFDIDSLDAVEMAFEYERRFDRQVDPEIFLDGTKTLSELLDVLI